ncbi:MAG TPA: ABC transporter permease [Acidimicrobiales bacterium]|nr:ABC transporter permease [Acidimicrobiales bacterium]
MSGAPLVETDVRGSAPPGAKGAPSGFTWVRQEASATRGWIYRLVAVAISLAVAAVYLVATVHTPDVLGLVLHDTFVSEPGVEELVVLATPFFLTALAVVLPLRVGLWNVGGEGQFFAGAWLATALAFAIPHGSGPLLIIGMLVAGAAGGALWSVIPTLAKLYLNVSEVITTLMLNFVILLWVDYWITGSWRYGSSQGGIIASRFIATAAHLPMIPLEGGLDSGIVIAVGITLVVGIFLRYSGFGYRSLVAGSGSATAAFAGVRVRRVALASMLLGGGLAGIGGVLQLAGNSYQLTPGLSNDTGYLGIAVAALAGGSVTGVVLMSCVLAVLMSAGQAVQLYGVSSEDVFIVIGLLLLLSTAAEVASHNRLAWRGRPASAMDGLDGKGAPMAPMPALPGAEPVIAAPLRPPTGAATPAGEPAPAASSPASAPVLASAPAVAMPGETEERGV